jgi:hypothetical protein
MVPPAQSYTVILGCSPVFGRVSKDERPGSSNTLASGTTGAVALRGSLAEEAGERLG